MDIEYLLALQRLREATGGALDGLMEAVTMLGALTLPMLLSAMIFWSVDKRAGTLVMLGVVVSLFLNQIVKLTACVYRPWIRDSRVHPVPGAIPAATGYSFPSGHTANAGALLGGVAMARPKEKGLRVYLAALWLLVGFSRNYLGVHTPQDVIVSMALTLLALMGSRALFAVLEKSRDKDGLVLGAGLAAGVCLMLYVLYKPYPMDIVNGALLVDPKDMIVDGLSIAGATMGFVLGWYVERRWIRFEMGKGFWKRALRFIVGVAGMFALQAFVVPLFERVVGVMWGQCAGLFVMALYIMAGYPWVFCKVEKMRKM